MICDCLHGDTRLMWDGRRICAHFEGRKIALTAPPAELPAWHCVDYAPLMVATCRDRACDPERDLRRDEIEAIIAWLAAASVS